MTRLSYDFRDVSIILQKLREILLGRQHTLHGRFPPLISSRSIPAPRIPRGPDTNYSNQYFYKRTAYDSVKPPIVAPISVGPKPGPFFGPYPTKTSKAGGLRADSIMFQCAPTPGPSWWWDGHSYFEVVPSPCCPCPPASASGPSCSSVVCAALPPPFDPSFVPPDPQSDFPQQPLPDIKDMRPKPEKDTNPKPETEDTKKK